MMPRGLITLLLVTDLGFIVYWSVTALDAAGIIALPPAYLFKDYADPNMVAWNWSFMPLDLLASATGLWAVARSRADAEWQRIALLSATLTFCAGFLALCFWAAQGSFDALCWGMNLFLAGWPVWALSRYRLLAA